MFQGLRTVIYGTSDLAAAKAWYCGCESGREHLRAKAFGLVLGPRARVASADVVYEKSLSAAGPVGSEGNAAAFSSESTGRCAWRR